MDYTKRIARDRGSIATDRAALKSSTALATALMPMLMFSSSFSGEARAQQAAEPVPLPEITVQTKAKGKAAAKKKAAPTSAPAQAAPTTQAPSEGLGDGPAVPGANPYANPDAPYQVQQSASGMLTQPLADTPRTVTALPKEVIEDKGARDIRELARQVPGVSITAGEGGAAAQQFNIRGFNARNDIFVDGIRDPGNIGRDVFAVEQLEIYKGPSGSISGRATPAGAFNFITKTPDLDGNFFEVATTVGTDKTFRTTVDANQVVTPDFAVRANILYHENEVAGRDFTDDQRWGGLLSATARVTEDVTVTLDYYRVRRDGMPDAGVPMHRADGVPWTERGLPRDTFYGELGLDFLDERSDVGTATIVAKLSEGVTLTNRTRYGQNVNDYIMTTPRAVAGQEDLNGPLQTGAASREMETSLFANQTLLNAAFRTGSLRHDLVAGVEYVNEKIDRKAYAMSAIPPYVCIGGTCRVEIPVAGAPDPYRNTRTYSKARQFKADVETFGVFLGDTVHLTDQWIVHGGVRFDDFTRDQVGPTPAHTNTVKIHEGLWSWNAGIVYKPIPNASFYASYATAQSPLGNELDSTGTEYNGVTQANAHLPPQEIRGIEIGTKWELFGGRMLATAALFETIKDKARPESNNPNVSGGKHRVRGIELGVAGNITDEWSIFGGAVFLDTEVLKSAVPAQVGRRLANAPLTQFSLLSKYQLTDQLTVGGQAIYQSAFYTGHHAVNDWAYSSASYWRFDAFAEYEIDDHWTIEVSGLNLTDELYYDAIYQANDGWAYVAPGRSGYLTVKWKY